MHRTVEAQIDADGQVRLLELVKLSEPRRALVTILDPVVAANDIPETALLSEPALAEDWDRDEEDAAWAYLQPGPSS
jgi:hypothetical protein